MTEEKIGRQLRGFKEQGIGAVFIHPRPGLITEYLSERWFELVDYTLGKAEELEMKVWLYDENSFPSGFAGGHVPAQMPDAYQYGQSLRMKKVARLHPDEEYFLVLRKGKNDFVDVTSRLGDTFKQAGSFYTFQLGHYPRSGWQGGFPYVDLLYEGVTDAFIDITMDGYESAVAQAFGDQVPGIFTDEPNIATPGPEERGERTIRYTPDLFEEFERRWGYDLRPHLVSLFEEVGEWRRVRHNYYKLLLDLFIERWSKPWFEYTEANNLTWTGHYWEHGWPSPDHGGDNMAMYAWHQMPGIDMLFNAPERRPDQFGNVRAVKELSSVANQLGRRRRLSETYGGAGWELRFEDMKRLGDWQYALGVNFLNQHLSYSTLKGARKRDFPQSFSYHAPWWNHYEPLADYFARLSLALSSGQEVNRTLILEPTTTAWMYHKPGETVASLDSIEQSFGALLDELEQRQIEYDLGSERIMADHARIKDSLFIIDERAYDLVVLPPYLENVNDRTVTLLQEYLVQGGEILSIATIPGHMSGSPTERLRGLAETHSSQWLHLPTRRDSRLHTALKRDDFMVEAPTEFGGRVFHLRRQFDSGQLIFWSNWSLEESASGQFTVFGSAVEQLVPFTGKVDPYDAATHSDGKVTIPIELAPGGSLLLFVHEDDESAPVDRETISKTEETVSPDGATDIRRLKPNILMLDYLDYRVDGHSEEEAHYTAAADSIFKHSGLSTYGLRGHNPWERGIQYKTNIVDQNTLFGTDSGFEATYSFDVGASLRDRTSLQAVVEWAGLYEVQINGQRVEPIPDVWAIDRSFDVFDVSSYVETGTNHLTLTAKSMSIHAEVEPVYLMGDFDLGSQEQGFRLTSPSTLEHGPWDEQGLPMYPYGISYEQSYDFAPGNSTTSYAVRLPEWLGTVAEVRVNGQSAGIIGWKPYELEVTNLLQKGSNDVEVIVYGSLKNLLGPHHSQEEPGFVTPGSFGGPRTQPQGLDYNTLGYGLREPFDLLRQGTSAER